MKACTAGAAGIWKHDCLLRITCWETRLLYSHSWCTKALTFATWTSLYLCNSWFLYRKQCKRWMSLCPLWLVSSAWSHWGLAVSGLAPLSCPWIHMLKKTKNKNSPRILQVSSITSAVQSTENLNQVQVGMRPFGYSSPNSAHEGHFCFLPEELRTTGTLSPPLAY